MIKVSQQLPKLSKNTKGKFVNNYPNFPKFLVGQF